MHRRSRLVLASAAAVLLGFSLTACAPESTPEGSATPSPTSSPADSPTPTPTPAARVVEISVEGISVDGTPTLSYRDADGVITALTDVFGAAPAERPVEGPYGGVYDGFDWEGTTATVRETNLDLVVSADAPGVTFRTPEGIGLGSTRAEAMAAGAEDEWDEDGDGIADYLIIGMREVPDTESLRYPGEVGVEYITLDITDDVVTRLSSGGNDFSDI